MLNSESELLTVSGPGNSLGIAPRARLGMSALTRHTKERIDPNPDEAVYLAGMQALASEAKSRLRHPLAAEARSCRTRRRGTCQRL